MDVFWGSCFSGVKDEENNWVYRVGYTWSTVVAAAGTRVAYDHRDYLWEDKVEIPGPTQHELKIKVNESPAYPFLIVYFSILFCGKNFFFFNKYFKDEAILF